jgi:hypothetical protein
MVVIRCYFLLNAVFVTNMDPYYKVIFVFYIALLKVSESKLKLNNKIMIFNNNSKIRIYVSNLLCYKMFKVWLELINKITILILKSYFCVGWKY